jgi:7,8-dihydroneopterin aldolase/epimerase/oxygenase
MKSDEIILRGIEFSTHIGVPKEERAASQMLEADVTLRVARRFEDMADEIHRTVDYAAVADAVREVAASRERRLIETLAAEIADRLLRRFEIESIVIEVRKRILPRVDHVAVRIERHSDGHDDK